MRIALFSDIHGNLPALKVILNDINNNNFDQVICLGDVIGIGPKSKETLEMVLNSNIELLLGNHELYYIKGLEIDDGITDENIINHHRYIQNSIKEIPRERLNYPLSKEININGKKLVFSHYMITKDMDLYPFETLSINNPGEIENYCKNMDCDYLFIGHEHNAFEVHENNKHIICLGSSGCVKTNKTFYTIVDINDDIKVTKKEIIFNRDEFINDVRKTNYPARDFIAKELFGIDNIKEGE